MAYDVLTSYQFEAIGTQWQIDTPEPLTDSVKESLAHVAEQYDRGFSRFRADSVVRNAMSPGSYLLPDPASALETLYRSLYRLTGGSMTPLVGASLEHLGYDSHYSLQPGAGFQAAPQWEEAISWQGTSLQVRIPVLLDVGAAGKGQLVDLLSGCLETAGISQYLIDASGDLLSRGLPAQRVALEHPYDQSKAIGIVELSEGALCASASNRRAWGDGLHHVLDGATGKPIQTVVASWVSADSTLVADGLATALFFADIATLSTEFDFTAVRMFSDGSAEVSSNFMGEIFR